MTVHYRIAGQGAMPDRSLCRMRKLNDREARRSEDLEQVTCKTCRRLLNREGDAGQSWYEKGAGR